MLYTSFVLSIFSFYAHIMLKIVLSDVDSLQAFSTRGQLASNNFPKGTIKNP